MAQYIDKSALVAEIEKRITEIDKVETYLSPKGILTNLLCYINALEIKDVDLEKAFYDFLDTLIGKDNGHLSEDARCNRRKYMKIKSLISNLHNQL
jgi:hypothetical protein